MKSKQPLTMPAFVRLRTPSWGANGSSLGGYLAALLDLPDLENSRVLGIDGNADLLLGVANGVTEVESYVAVEPDLVTAAFFASHVRNMADVEIVITDLVDKSDETLEQLRPGAPFDVFVVRTPVARLNDEHLGTLLTALRGLAGDASKLVITLALAHTTASGTGAGDRLAERGLLDTFDGYLEYEWELGTIPIYSAARAGEIAAASGWQVDEVCEPRRGFQQHHLVLSAA